MTSRRSPQRRSSGSRAALGRAAVLSALFAFLPAGARAGDERPAGRSPLVESRAGAEIDWSAGTITASAGAAADLRMPSADVARAGAVRHAEAAARAKLAHVLSDLPLGGDRKLDAAAIDRAVEHASRAGADYQSNGGAIVRVTARFADWLSPPGDQAPVVTIAVPSMHLAAAPVVKLVGAERTIGAAVYRLGAPPAGALTAKADRAGRLVVDAKQASATSAEKLAGGVAVIYVGKVLR